jgi:hypothetical protein
MRIFCRIWRSRPVLPSPMALPDASPTLLTSGRSGGQRRVTRLRRGRGTVLRSIPSRIEARRGAGGVVGASWRHINGGAELAAGELTRWRRGAR